MAGSMETRGKGKLGSPGPYLAEVTNHLDPTYMGGLEVVLIQGMMGSTKLQGNTYPVKYLSPFGGSTSIRYEGNNSGDFNDVQKSYGMWMVPPDVGTTVMVIFIDGEPNQGYWIGCAQDTFQNHMVPDMAASKHVQMTVEQRRKFGTDYLPVAEFHKASQDLNNPSVSRIAKPIHPFANRLLAQGLLLDTTRGVSSSSARREVPSGVFGISTPGPLDTSPGAKRGKIGYAGGKEAPVSRLGGSSFVMDDGDIKGENELIRIRTRTGHQILLHNSQDLIYIANSKGSAWIEMTSNGKLDIYAHDSVSIHTEADFNFRADRDINLEAGRNINIRAFKNMETNIAGHYFLLVDDHAKISVRNNKDETIGGTSKTTVMKDCNMLVGETIRITADGMLNLASGSDMKQSSNASFNISATGNYLETAAQIHMNGPAAIPAEAAFSAEVPPLLPTYKLPNTDTKVGWANGNFYKTEPLTSIMSRVPTHEPWPQHENVNPEKFSSAATDAGLQSRSASGVADNPATGIQTPANESEVTPGTCDTKYANDINNAVSKQGIQSIKDACAKLGLTSPKAVASLLGIVGGESRWKPVEESFNYTAGRLLQVFPSGFKGDSELAQKYAGNPNNSLPEFLYGYQTTKGKDLGNTQPNDGSKYIGRGYIQLTGRSNYAKYSQQLFDKGLLPSNTALLDDPTLMSNPDISAQVSVLYLLDRVKVPQTDPGYFEAASKAVGYNTPDIHATKRGFYECFNAQLQGNVVGTGSNGILTDSQGNPVKTGSGS